MASVRYAVFTDFYKFLKSHFPPTTDWKIRMVDYMQYFVLIGSNLRQTIYDEMIALMPDKADEINFMLNPGGTFMGFANCGEAIGKPNSLQLYKLSLYYYTGTHSVYNYPIVNTSIPKPHTSVMAGGNPVALKYAMQPYTLKLKYKGIDFTDRFGGYEGYIRNTREDLLDTPPNIYGIVKYNDLHYYMNIGDIKPDNDYTATKPCRFTAEEFAKLTPTNQIGGGYNTHNTNYANYGCVCQSNFGNNNGAFGTTFGQSTVWDGLCRVGYKFTYNISCTMYTNPTNILYEYSI